MVYNNNKKLTKAEPNKVAGQTIYRDVFHKAI
jgi:hypothetical protein